MEEAAFGESGRFANVFDPRGAVAFGPDDMESGVQEFRFGFVLCFSHFHGASNVYPLVGIQSSFNFILLLQNENVRFDGWPRAPWTRSESPLLGPLFLCFPRPQNRRCSGKYLLRRLGWDLVLASKPVLDVAPTVLGAFQAERFKANHRSRFGLDLADASWS